MLKNSRGFTLIELSIVLVIIGLIVGGVLTGQDLIRAAYVRAQISQIEKFNTAVNTFYGKYQALPGDMNRDTALANGFSSRGTVPGSGDGNGLIEGVANYGWGGTTIGNAVLCGEGTQFWNDLSKANGQNINLIEGSFTGTWSGVGFVNYQQMTQYFPAAKIGQGNIIVAWSGGYNTVLNKSDGANYFSIISFYMMNSSSQCMAVSQPGLTAQQAYNIDAKVDDGYPQSGRVLAMYPPGINAWSSNSTPAFDPNIGMIISGDYDQTTNGPINANTTSPFYFTSNGGTLAQSCYNNGNTLAPEHYSVEINHGAGTNCELSFRFQ